MRNIIEVKNRHRELAEAQRRLRAELPHDLKSGTYVDGFIDALKWVMG